MEKLFIICATAIVLAMTSPAFSQDSDSDGMPDAEDNCPTVPNGLSLGTCVDYACNDGWIGIPCTHDDDCISDDFCSMHQEDVDGDGLGDVCDNCPRQYNPQQEDTSPPQGNGIGDACDCESNFDCDCDVDADDVRAFLADFGRNQWNNPCDNANPCNGDFYCNGSVDALDIPKFLEDFGR